MSTAASMNRAIDNGGRRLGIERRQFSYTDYIPSRRSSKKRRSSSTDRRNDIDRRNGTRCTKFTAKERRKTIERRNGLKRRATFTPVRSNKKAA